MDWLTQLHWAWIALIVLFSPALISMFVVVVVAVNTTGLMLARSSISVSRDILRSR